MGLGERGEVSPRQPAQDTSLLARQSGSPGSRDHAAAPPSSPGTPALLGPRLWEGCLARPEQSAGALAPGAAGRAPGEDSRGETLACRLA